MTASTAATPRFKFKAKRGTPQVDQVWGIDPGKSGALVSVLPGGKLGEVIKMPGTDKELATLLDTLVAEDRSDIWIERIPKFAGKNQSGASVATLFANYRFIVGYLNGRGIEVQEVVPQVWMKPYRLSCKNWQTLSYNDRKKYLHQVALAEFFTDNKTLPRWAADAALIALHGTNNTK